MAPMAPKAKEAKQEQDPDGRREAEEAVEKNIEREKVVQPLKCEFTPEELLDLADEMTQKMDTREKKQSEFDSIKKQYNGELSTLDEEVRVKQRLIRDKYEFRSIPCQIERDYNTRTFTLTRLDTSEIVEQRKLRASELQRRMFKEEYAATMEEPPAAAVNE